MGVYDAVKTHLFLTFMVFVPTEANQFPVVQLYRHMSGTSHLYVSKKATNCQIFNMLCQLLQADN